MPKVPRKKRNQGPQSKHWCFTINNYTREDEHLISDNLGLIHYVIMQKEVGEEGTKHIQGYCIFKKIQYMTGAKKLFPRAHLEIKRGTIDEAVHYCKKPVEGCNCKHCIKARKLGCVPDFREYGEIPKGMGTMGERWDEARKLAETGDFDSIPSAMFTRYQHSYRRMFQEKCPKPPALTTKKRNEWYVAPTDFGKSTYVWKKYPDAYDKMPNKWWIRYRDEVVVILDDWGPKQCEYMSFHLKRWGDVYAYMGENKGSGRFLRPAKIVVTSQYTIDESFTDPKVAAAIHSRYIEIHLEHWTDREKKENRSGYYSALFSKQL